MKEKIVFGLAGLSTAAMAIVPSFASEASSPQLAITAAMLKPITDGLIANIGVILPVGIGIFTVMQGVKLIPRVISWFKN